MTACEKADTETFLINPLWRLLFKRAASCRKVLPDYVGI